MFRQKAGVNMFYSLIRRIFVALLAVIAFFTNLTAVPSSKETPDGAISVVYADTVWGDVKVFLPESIDPDSPTDVLLTIHGGAWVSGHAGIFYRDCRKAAEAGYIAATMNYSKIFNGATAQDMVREVGLAIAAIKAELAQRGIKPGKLILAGHSAGAHIMLLYAYTQYENCPMDIAFVVSNCAPSDFLAEAKAGRSMVGKAAYLLLSGLTKEVVVPSTVNRNADAIRAITTVEMITPDVPPTIVVQGTDDKLISYQSAQDIYAALQEKGVDSVLITYEGAGHFLSSRGDTRFAAYDAQRSEAFYAFAQKYASQK